MKRELISARLFGTLLAVPLLLLAACQTVSRVPGDGGGASARAVGYLSEIRASNGLPALAYDATLEKAALEQARNMARSGRMSHTTGWGKDFATRIRSNGVDMAAAENIAYGRMSLDDLFRAWMNSSGHRRNMLDPRFSRFGLAYMADQPGSDRRYWALVLAR